MSCLIHAALFLILQGCAAHRPIPVEPMPDPEMAEARDYVLAVADKMPLWDADDISRYERVEIATVKADIAMAQQQQERSSFLEYVARLSDDWDSLVALDERLKKESLI
jgi:hypothetical protein